MVAKLGAKNECLKGWNSLVGWSHATGDQLNHILQQLGGIKLGAQELAHLLSEAEEVQLQCDNQASKWAHLDDKSRSCGLLLSDTVDGFVGRIEKQISRVRQLVTSRTNEIRQLDDKWSEFESEREELMQRLCDAKTSAEQLTSSVPVITDLSDITDQLVPVINELLAETKSIGMDKEALHKTGKTLTQLSPDNLGSVQNTLTGVDTEWEALRRMLLDKQTQCDEIGTLWRECSDARVPIEAAINDGRRVLEGMADRQPPADLSEAVALNDQCRKSSDQLRKCRLPLDHLTTRSAQLHDKLDRLLSSVDTTALRLEINNLQRDFADLQAAQAARMQTLDMQQVVLRQLAGLKDEILNWTSDTRESLMDALQPSIELEVMEMKLTKAKQELPNYVTIADNMNAKMDQLVELSQGKHPSSAEADCQLVKREMDATRELCTRLESAVFNIGRQEDELRNDFKMLSTQLVSMKAELKNSEDVTAPVHQHLAEQWLAVRKIRNDAEPQLKESLASVQRRCVELQSQRGVASSAADASPLTKEMRSVQKKADAVTAQAKKLADHLHDVLQKVIN